MARMVPQTHTIRHALRPHECKCSRDQITESGCVMCGAWLQVERKHVDTCGEGCFRRLCILQRAGVSQ